MRSRRAIIVAVLMLVMVVRVNSYDDLALRALRFDKPWNVFIRKLFGCPETGLTNRETCNMSYAVRDEAAYERARREAKRMFGLRER